MTQHTLRYVGFDPKQQEAISAILDLAESALTDIWLVTDDPDSDMAMINLDADDGQQLLATEQQLRPPYRIILVAELSDMEIDTYWFLAKKHHAPPSLKELNKLLNEVAVVLSEAAQAAITPTTSPESNGENTGPEVLPDLAEDNSQPEPEPVKNTVPLTRPLYPRNYFFGMLLQAKKDNACRLIERNKQTSLYLSPSENSYYFTGSASDLLTYCTASTKYLKETVITKQLLAKILKSGRKLNAQSLDGLLAYAVIEASQGRLLEGHSLEQTFKLTQLPDTNNIPMLAGYKKIAEFMHKQPGNLFDAAETLQTPLATIFEFYNACYLLGYLTIDTTAKIEPTPIEQKKSGKLSNFLKLFLAK